MYIDLKYIKKIDCDPFKIYKVLIIIFIAVRDYKYNLDK